jgi:ABC-type sugar transport system permease subunit
MQVSLLKPEVPTVRKPSPRKTGLWHRIEQNIWSYLYLAPMFILFLVFVVYPLFASMAYTLYRWNGIGDPTLFVGLENFQRVILDSLFWNAFLHTFTYAAVLVPIQLALALALALVLNNPKLRLNTFYRTVYFIPVVTSAAVVGVVIQLLLSNFGDKFGQLLIQAHLMREQVDWLGDPRFALGIIIVVGIWQTLGYNLIYFLAALQTIPTELYEAARIDGANAVDSFFNITIPMLRAIGLVILLLAILGSLQIFDLVQVLTGGGPNFASEVVNTYIYHQAFGGSRVGTQPNVGFASAASFFYGIILLGLAGLQVLAFRAARRHRASVV